MTANWGTKPPPDGWPDDGDDKMKLLRDFLGHHGNRVALAILAGCVASLMALLGGLTFMAQRQDAQSLENQITMVQGGFSQMGDGLSGMTQDYGWWDDLYSNVVGNGPDEWFTSNVSSTVSTNKTIDLSVILDENMKPFRVYHEVGSDVSDPAFASEQFISQIGMMLKGDPQGQFPARRGIVTLPDGDYLVAITHIYPTTASLLRNAEKQPYYINGYKLGDARLAQLGTTYLLDGLVYKPGKAMGLVQLADVAGIPVGALSWTPAKPGTQVLKNSLPLILSAAALIFIFAGASAWRGRRVATALAERGDALQDINDEIVRLNKELADKVLRLKEAQDELVKKGRMEQLGQLTATIAHEIRNPLGAVRTSAFLLERKVKGKELGIEPQIERINKGILRCDDIITQLLDFSRTKQLNCQPGDLDSWLVRTLDDEAKKLPAAIAISCDLGLGGRHVPFDPARLQRAIVNLLSNASEAMVGQGDDPASFAVVNPEITMTTWVEDGWAVLQVKDNGPGIPADVLARIREPCSPQKSLPGLGVRHRADAIQHGGSLEIASSMGAGALRCACRWSRRRAT
ncbi:MAG: histidine kinase dimerization/phospho-acceptor domain-containing protein [Hyphomicrobiales bacterium]